VPPPGIADALKPLPHEIQKRFLGGEGWRPLDLATPFDKALRLLP
jgi:hypothetical protein